MDKLGQAIFHQTPTADFMISIPDADVEQLPPDFEIQINDTKKIFTLSSWLITLLITLVSGCITYFVSGYALRPLRSFSDRITQIQAENLMQYQSEEQQIPEFQALSHSFEAMVRRLSDAFSSLQEFNGNAAHEFRTPLAMMQAQLELYEEMPHPDMDAETAELLAMLKEQTERLSKLVKTLLEMSEMNTIERAEAVELTALIEEVLADLSPMAEKRQISLLQEATGEVLCREAIFCCIVCCLIWWKMPFATTKRAERCAFRQRNGRIRWRFWYRIREAGFPKQTGKPFFSRSSVWINRAVGHTAA